MKIQLLKLFLASTAVGIGLMRFDQSEIDYTDDDGVVCETGGHYFKLEDQEVEFTLGACQAANFDSALVRIEFFVEVPLTERDMA